VQAEEHWLSVRGVRRERHAASGPDVQRSYHTLEIPYGRFERKLHLPPGTDTGAARANYRDGVLEITVPKRQPRHVPISAQDGP
jgi:HSP20 family protein